MKHCSDVYHLVDEEKEEILFPGISSYQNELGGTVVVCSGNSDVPYNFSAFAFLNETRKAQFAGILRELGALPVYFLMMQKFI